MNSIPTFLAACELNRSEMSSVAENLIVSTFQDAAVWRLGEALQFTLSQTGGKRDPSHMLTKGLSVAQI